MKLSEAGLPFVALGLTGALAWEQITGHGKSHIESQQPPVASSVFDGITATNTTAGLQATLWSEDAVAPGNRVVPPRVIY
jgi:hypothetical protein